MYKPLLLVFTSALAFVGVVTTASAYIPSEGNTEKVVTVDSQPPELTESFTIAQRRWRGGYGGYGGGYGGGYVAPIIGRDGGIPVINATFNDSYTFPMLVDTGASITTITPKMARTIGFRRTGSVSLILANGQETQVPVGYVSSINVGGAVMRNFKVVVTDTPLLGQNFYSAFNMTIGQRGIVFRPRR